MRYNSQGWVCNARFILVKLSLIDQMPMSPNWSSQALMIVPTYNERENLSRLVQRLRALPGDVHVLIVDDNSPDGSGAIADTIAASDSGVHVLHRHGDVIEAFDAWRLSEGSRLGGRPDRRGRSANSDRALDKCPPGTVHGSSPPALEP